ncbi:MAG TPA: hypothetical protein VKR32_18855 [Puia sp.]|nr:hypothetical protein [Puia sp.]
MNIIVKRILGIGLFSSCLIFLLSGCYETHYYNRYHHHTRDWYDRRHEPPPAGVDFNIDVDRR